MIFKGVFLSTADINENFASEPLGESAWSGIRLSALNHTSLTYWLCDFGHKS